jgi:Ser/Thr protein kinase RdoA (MazF antagonist)
MSTHPFPVQHSILSENALADWASSRYGLKKPVRCRFLRGSMSDAYRLETLDAAYILKVYLHDRHPRSAIEAEIVFLNDLLEQDIPVAVPVVDLGGEYVNEIATPEGIRYAVLFQAIEGAEPKEENLEHSRSFGQLAGRIHRFADLSPKIYQRRHLDETYWVAEPLTSLQPYLAHRANDLETLRSLGSELMAELRRLLPRQSPEYGLCHGDLHTGNARFDQNGRLTLFDFDSFGYGWRALDIGVYHVSFDWMALDEATRRKKERFWAAFLEGYTTQRSLSHNELAAAQLCFPLRHLELMGLTIRYWSPQIGSGWITDEYFDRHLHWFKAWADGYGKTSG